MALRILIVAAIVGALIVCSPRNLYAQADARGLEQATAMTHGMTPTGHQDGSRATQVRKAGGPSSSASTSSRGSAASRIAELVQDVPGLRWLFGGQDEPANEPEEPGSGGEGTDDICELFLGCA